MLLALRPSFVPWERLRALLPFAVLASSGALVFAWLADAVGDHDGITVVDRPVAAWFAAHRSLALGHDGLLAAKATSPAVLVGLTLVGAALLWWRGHRRGSVLLAGSVAVAYAAGAAAKLGEHRARPVAPVNLAPEGEPSFPSGHVLVVATIVGVLLVLAWDRMSTAMRVLASLSGAAVVVLVALDRLVVGAHWLTDVVGALALASIVVALAAVALRLTEPDRT